ncbi:MAG: hypothetical protein Ta2A_06760 [Treponemataceae bacterium]|nr:MAG: hypothetical protein Ta2A_06760 [Treponemataceae bacterium]
MAIKIPGIFKKPIKENQFSKKILRYIEQNTDKEFLQNSFELKDGFYCLQALGDTKDDKKKVSKLQSLAKDIKANRALPVNFIPLAGVGILVAGAFIFFTILMNPLLERAIEGALQNAFEAKVDIKSFNLNLLRFKVGFRSMTIANSEEPMTNLLEMSRTEIRLLPQAVLRGKIYIEEIRADSIRFGTPRKTSGAIFTPEQLAKRHEPKPKSSAPPLVDLEKFDAMALIEQQYDKLLSPKLYGEVVNFYSTAETKWKGQLENSQKQVADLRDKAQPFLSFDARSIDVSNPQTVATVLKMVEDGKAMLGSVQDTVAQVNEIASGIEQEIANVNALKRNAQNSVNEDFAYLQSFLNLADGPYAEIVSGALQQILSSSARKYIAYAERFLSAANKLQAYQKEQAKAKPKAVVYKGRDVQFAQVRYPKFYLGIFASNFTINGWNSSFDLRNVSSQPELTNNPTTLKINVSETAGAQKAFAVDARADFRQSQGELPAADATDSREIAIPLHRRDELFSVDVTGKNISVGVQQELVGISEIGIGGFEGNLAFEASASGNRSGDYNVSGALALEEPAILNATGTLGESIDEAVREAGLVDIRFDFLHMPNDTPADSFSMKSNLLSLIQAALRKAAAKYLARAQAELEKALRAYISDFLKDKNIAGADLDSLFALAKGDRSAITALQNSLTTKLTELETKAKGTATEKIDEAKDRAAKAAEDAAAEASRQAAEQKRRAEEEAKRRAEEAAKNALRGKLPF